MHFARRLHTSAVQRSIALFPFLFKGHYSYRRMRANGTRRSRHRSRKLHGNCHGNLSCDLVLTWECHVKEPVNQELPDPYMGIPCEHVSHMAWKIREVKLPEHHQILAITFGGLPHFPEISGLSRSSVLGLTLVHKIVVFGRNLNRGSFERHLSAPHIGIPCKDARKSASTWEFHVIPKNHCFLHRIPM